MGHIYTDTLNALERAIDESHAATKAVIQLAKAQAAESDRKSADDDEWVRMPRPRVGCRVSGMSASTISRRDDIRKKHVGGCRYYSLADVRNIISKP